MQKDNARLTICVPVIAVFLAATSTAWAENVSSLEKAGGKAIANQSDRTQVAVANGTLSLHLEQVPAQEAFALIANKLVCESSPAPKLMSASPMYR
jgi:hypothetical protein